MNNLMLAMLMLNNTQSSNWDISTFLTNLTTQLKSWGGLVIMLLGVVMVVVAIWKVATGLMSHGKGQPPNWLLIAILFLLGGAFVVAGASGMEAFNWVAGIAGGGKQTIIGLGNGGTTTILFNGLR